MIPLYGCATLFTGTTDTITFNSNVPDVRLSIDGQYKGDLPLTLTLSRNFLGGARFIARFEKEGYETQEFQLTREFNTVAILDVTSIVTSSGIDMLTGSIMRFSPTDYHIHMREVSPKQASNEYTRSLRLYRYALMNHRNLQRDISRGGGEYLSAFAAEIGRETDDSGASVRRQIIEHAQVLAGADSAHRFVAQINEMLTEDPGLAGYRF